MVVFTRKFGTLDPHLPIVWDKVPKNGFFRTPSLSRWVGSMVGGLNDGQPMETWMTKDSGQVEEWTGAHIFLLTSERSTNKKINERSLSKPWRILVAFSIALKQPWHDKKKTQNPSEPRRPQVPARCQGVCELPQAGWWSCSSWLVRHYSHHHCPLLP